MWCFTVLLPSFRYCIQIAFNIFSFVPSQFSCNISMLQCLSSCTIWGFVATTIKLPLGCAVGLYTRVNQVLHSEYGNYELFHTIRCSFWVYRTFIISPLALFFQGLQMENVHGTWWRWRSNNLHQRCCLQCQPSGCGNTTYDQGVVRNTFSLFFFSSAKCCLCYVSDLYCCMLYL